MEEENKQEEETVDNTVYDNHFENQKLLISTNTKQHFIKVVNEKNKGA